MLKRTCIFVAALSFLVVLGLPLAQAQSVGQLIVHVPFDFYAGDRMLPAGAYSIRAINEDGSALLIRSEDGREAVAVITNGAEAKGRKMDAPHVLFNRYGEQYFLTSAWQDARNGRMLTESRREHSLRRELAQGHGTAAPEVVAIVAASN